MEAPPMLHIPRIELSTPDAARHSIQLAMAHLSALDEFLEKFSHHFVQTGWPDQWQAGEPQDASQPQDWQGWQGNSTWGTCTWEENAGSTGVRGEGDWWPGTSTSNGEWQGPETGEEEKHQQELLKRLKEEDTTSSRYEKDVFRRHFEGDAQGVAQGEENQGPTEPGADRLHEWYNSEGKLASESSANNIETADGESHSENEGARSEDSSNAKNEETTEGLDQPVPKEQPVARWGGNRHPPRGLQPPLERPPEKAPPVPVPEDVLRGPQEIEPLVLRPMPANRVVAPTSEVRQHTQIEAKSKQLQRKAPPAGFGATGPPQRLIEKKAMPQSKAVTPLPFKPPPTFKQPPGPPGLPGPPPMASSVPRGVKAPPVKNEGVPPMPPSFSDSQAVPPSKSPPESREQRPRPVQVSAKEMLPRKPAPPPKAAEVRDIEVVDV